MFLFYVILTGMIASALYFLLPTLLGKPRKTSEGSSVADLNLAVLRDQLHELDIDLHEGSIDVAAYQKAKADLEKRTLEDVHEHAMAAQESPHRLTSSIGAAIGLIVLSLGMYALLGSPRSIDEISMEELTTAVQGDTKNAGTTNAQLTNSSSQASIEALKRDLASNTNNAEKWNQLAQQYHAVKQYSEAADAYAHLITLIPPDAAVLADYADTLAMSQNRNLQGEPEKLIQRALKIDPRNIKALALAGTAAFSQKKYTDAAAYWKQILPLVSADPETKQSTIANIQEAETLSNGLVPSDKKTEAQSSVSDAVGAGTSSIEGIVSLDPALRKLVADSDTVFIFAKALDGPKFPLAVLKKQVKDLPFNFALDDSMSMMPNVKLSDFPMVLVGARVSKSGSAMPVQGDLEGVTEPTPPGTRGIKITINSQRP
ncbi:c-type cytochrome biogenesis protein CcmI [Undibacterium sp. Ji22W]|uniref:c-type cytochrome biogenesis protein CcmI n=1 Tax=Undibacterium sp. Ji22W TaxID=3413038 RepID=UPI003BF14F41